MSVQVFVGLLDPSGNSPSMKILRAIEQQKEREEDPVERKPQDPEVRARGQIVPLELDSTREDSLRACLDAVRAKLPAGEDGKQYPPFNAIRPRLNLAQNSHPVHFPIFSPILSVPISITRYTNL